MAGTKTYAFGLPVLVAAVVTAGALRWLPPGTGDREPPAQEIVLVARGMAFRELSDPGTVNPTLPLPAGRRVRLTLRNEEVGVTHNFAIPAWRVDTGSVAGPGETHVEFVVPRTKGREAYQCTPHATMMHGGIVVE